VPCVREGVAFETRSRGRLDTREDARQLESAGATRYLLRKVALQTKEVACVSVVLTESLPRRIVVSPWAVVASLFFLEKRETLKSPRVCKGLPISAFSDKEKQPLLRETVSKLSLPAGRGREKIRWGRWAVPASRLTVGTESPR
jgi:hypothetical protein